MPTENAKSSVNLLFGLLAIAGLALVVALVMYTRNFGPSLSNDREVWAQFGDYLGGTLNPVFGYLTFVAIVMTLAVQARQLELSSEQLTLSREELAATREELKRGADAQRETAEALIEQARLAALSAKISAVSAALEATNQQLNRERQAASSNPMGFTVFRTGADPEQRRELLQAKLDELLAQAGAA
jgi:hypothetical protein